MPFCTVFAGEAVQEIDGKPILPPGTQVELVDPDDSTSLIAPIAVWYMFEDECAIDVAHDHVSSGTRATIAGARVCYARDYSGSQCSYYYKVAIPSLTYPTDNSWVDAKYVVPMVEE
jgi:hypothetical protein